MILHQSKGKNSTKAAKQVEFQINPASVSCQHQASHVASTLFG